MSRRRRLSTLSRHVSRDRQPPSAWAMRAWRAAPAAGAAILLAAAGGRWGRRAALRGVFAAGIAQAWTRIPGSGPPALLTTTAFAAGAIQELEPVMIPVPVAAAAIVAAQHRAVPQGTLVTAITAGTSVGLLTRSIWPVAQRRPSTIRAVRSERAAQPSADGEGLVVVVNADAGPALVANPADALRHALPRAEVLETSEELDLDAALAQAVERGRAIGMAGGDGSINAAGAAAQRSGKPLLVVPAGTLNHLARDLGLGSVDDAIEAVKVGNMVAVDCSVIAGKAFLNTASLGAYVDLVDARERLEHRIGKWPAVVVALGSVLRSSAQVRVEINGERRDVWMIFIGNCVYDPPGFAPTWRDRLDDGMLDIRIANGHRPLSRLRLIAAAATGSLLRCPAYESIRAKKITVKSLDGPLRLARDGETFQGPAEFTIEKADQPVVMFGPAD